MPNQSPRPRRLAVPQRGEAPPPTDSLYTAAKSEYELTKLKYDSEQRREDSLIRQSGQMQSAFSFTTAALFMALPVLIEYRGKLPLEFFLLAGGTVTAALLVCLACATIAQSRREQKKLESGEALIRCVEENEAYFQRGYQLLRQLAWLYADLEQSLTENNAFRVVWIRRSMRVFYGAVGLSGLWGLVGLIWLFLGG